MRISDDTYMALLFLGGVGIFIACMLFAFIFRSRAPTNGGQSESPDRAAESYNRVADRPAIVPQKDSAADHGPPRRLNAASGLWNFVKPHLAYTVPAVLVVSLAHGGFLIEWANVVHEALTAQAGMGRYTRASGLAVATAAWSSSRWRRPPS